MQCKSLWIKASAKCINVNVNVKCFVFKSLNGVAPKYLSDLIKPYAPLRALRSADHLLLAVPRAKLKSRGDRAFAVAAPKLWNSLPLYIRWAQTLVVFKSSLKTDFYSLAFNAM